MANELLEGFHPHQIAAYNRLVELHGRAGLWVAMGGGKTRVALRYTQARQAKRVLVVSPIVSSSVWELECEKVNYPLDVFNLTSIDSVADRAKMLQQVGSGLVLVNYESYWRPQLKAAILKWAPTTIITDEAHRLRHRASHHSRFAGLLSSRPTVQTRLALSGTAITNGLQDAWSEYRFINPSIFGTWPEFEANFLMMGGYKNKQIIGYRNEPRARGLIASASFQWESDLPSPPDTKITVRLSPKTRAIYETLRRDAVALLESGMTVTGRMVLTLQLRLQQITSGFAREEGGECVDLKSYEKARVCLDLCSDAVAEGRRVVIFARFTWELDVLQRGLSKKFRVSRLDGKVPKRQQAKVVADFDSGHYDICLVQVQMGISIDLASASVAIFVSGHHSLDVMLQAKGRLSGALRQRHPVTFYHLITEKSVDVKLYKGLEKKVNVADRFTDLRYALRFFKDDDADVL